MAKRTSSSKTGKKTGKKAAAKLPANAMSKKAARIFAELAFAVGQGMEHRFARAKRTYILDDTASQYWLDRHQKSIPRALTRGANWTRDRQGVLLMAQLLGRKAADLALDDAAASGPVTVRGSHAKAASEEIGADQRCQGPQPGTGPYCDAL